MDVRRRLNEIRSELFTLRDHLQFIEKEITRSQKIERRRLDNLINKKRLSVEDEEMKIAKYEYDYKVEFLLPRLLRAPFLISLYAVYESAINDIAKLLKERQSQYLSINDIQGDPLEKAYKYFKHILKFDLYVNNDDWIKIKMLLDLRNAIAHANGRIDMLNEKTSKKVIKWQLNKIGLSSRHGYMIIEASLAKELYDAVRLTLNNLITRYKKLRS